MYENKKPSCDTVQNLKHRISSHFKYLYYFNNKKKLMFSRGDYSIFVRNM